MDLDTTVGAGMAVGSTETARKHGNESSLRSQDTHFQGESIKAWP